MDIVDLLLAILHHILVFALVGLLAAELALLQPGLSGSALGRLGRVDAAYAGVALAVVIVGVCRVVFGLKGWEYYVSNHAFWGKMIAFVLVGLLSIGPTRRIAGWRRRKTGAVPDSEVSAVRSWVKGEVLFVGLVLVFAAAMARGVGM